MEDIAGAVRRAAGSTAGHAGEADLREADEADLREARGAVALVLSGVAVDVVLCGLKSAIATAAAIAGEARAAGVALRMDPGVDGAVDLVVGPREG